MTTFNEKSQKMLEENTVGTETSLHQPLLYVPDRKGITLEQLSTAYLRQLQRLM